MIYEVDSTRPGVTPSRHFPQDGGRIRPDRRTRVIVPPRKGALLSPKSAMVDRNRHVRSINRLGRREWHPRSSFSKRSRVENVIYRYKAILGREMKARTLAGQRVEAKIGCRVLNAMAKLRMPES